MAWGLGIASTAKLSTEFRYILLNKTNEFLQDIVALEKRALKYAAPQDAMIVARNIPLPPQTSEEEEDLHDPVSRFDFPWLAQGEYRA